MKDDIKICRENLAHAEEQVRLLKKELGYIVQTCRHQWSEPVADHIYEKGYEIQGDPPGTMGVDWRGPTWVGAKTTNRWKRTCNVCGEVQYTNATDQHVTHTPRF